MESQDFVNSNFLRDNEENKEDDELPSLVTDPFTDSEVEDKRLKAVIRGKGENIQDYLHRQNLNEGRALPKTYNEHLHSHTAAQLKTTSEGDVISIDRTAYKRLAADKRGKGESAEQFNQRKILNMTRSIPRTHEDEINAKEIILDQIHFTKRNDLHFESDCSDNDLKAIIDAKRDDLHVASDSDDDLPIRELVKKRQKEADKILKLTAKRKKLIQKNNNLIKKINKQNT
jgi:hypothetical protein